MESVIGVYESNKDAVAALHLLQKSGYPLRPLSIVGKADLAGRRIRIEPNDNIERDEITIGALAGITLGILTGVGIFVIPGFGLLYGAGALVGAFAGLETGFIAGGMVAILTKVLGIDEANAKKYEHHLNKGNFLLFAPGDKKQIELAKHLLHTQGLSLQLTQY